MRGILWAVLLDPITHVETLYSNLSLHHITLFFDVSREDYENLIGKEFTVDVIANCYNSNIQALLCVVPQYIPHKRNSHITVSYVDGALPSDSNTMLEDGNYKTLEMAPFKCNVRVEFYEFSY